jgi:hypothetical protein
MRPCLRVLLWLLYVGPAAGWAAWNVEPDGPRSELERLREKDQAHGADIQALQAEIRALRLQLQQGLAPPGALAPTRSVDRGGQRMRRRLASGGCANGYTTADCIGLLSGCCMNWAGEAPVRNAEAGWTGTTAGAWIRISNASNLGVNNTPNGTTVLHEFAVQFNISSADDVVCASLELELAVSDTLHSVQLNGEQVVERMLG